MVEVIVSKKFQEFWHLFGALEAAPLSGRISRPEKWVRGSRWKSAPSNKQWLYRQSEPARL